MILYKIQLLGYKTDGTKEHHLWHCALCMPNLSSLPDHDFEFCNSHQGQSAYPGFSRRAGHIGRDKSKTCGFYQMQDCTG